MGVNMKLSASVILVGLVLGTAYGPLSLMRDIPDGALADTGWWQHVGEETVRSFATTTLAIIGVVAASLGLPVFGRKKGPDGNPT